jgi:hypothetical protein
LDEGDRFPEDFMFHLTKEAKAKVAANCDHLFQMKFPPAFLYALTEHDAIMAAHVVKPSTAIEASERQLVNKF